MVHWLKLCLLLLILVFVFQSNSIVDEISVQLQHSVDAMILYYFHCFAIANVANITIFDNMFHINVISNVIIIDLTCLRVNQNYSSSYLQVLFAMKKINIICMQHIKVSLLGLSSYVDSNYCIPRAVLKHDVCDCYGGWVLHNNSSHNKWRK